MRTVLQSSSVGPVRIAHKPSGTGEKECAVIIDPPKPGFGYIDIGTTLAAADHTDGTLLNLPSINTSVYVPMDTASEEGEDPVRSFATIGTQTVYNATPFTFTSGSGRLWVKEANGIWLIDRPMNWLPHAHFSSVSAPSSSPTWGTTEPAWGQIATSSGTTITISAPFNNHLSRVKWSFTATFVFSFLGTPVPRQNWFIGALISATGNPILSGTTSWSCEHTRGEAGTTDVLFPGTTVSGGGEFIAMFTQNDTLSMSVDYTDGGSVGGGPSSGTYKIHIEPMF